MSNLQVSTAQLGSYVSAGIFVQEVVFPADESDPSPEYRALLNAFGDELTNKHFVSVIQ